MNSLELLKRIFTLGEEPFPIKSIAYHTDYSKLFFAVRDALHNDEYEELKESRLGVFLKFKEMDFGWASRMVHYMLCFQLNIKKKYEFWSLVGADPVRFSLIEFEQLTGLNSEYIEHLENPRCEVTNEMVSFWERIGVSVDAGPSLEQIIRSLKRCQKCATRASLARLVMDLEKFENYPWGRVAFKVLMDSLRAKNFTKSYTVDGFIQVLQASIHVSGVNKAYIEKYFKDLTDVMRDGFGTCLKEMKLLENRMDVVEKKLEITGKGTFSDDLQHTTSSPPKRERIKYSLEPFTYERPTIGVPQCIAGDCGMYALKYMECHALGYTSFPAAFCEKNVKHIREKMAHDIFHETPGFEGIEDKSSYYNNLDTYVCM
ncbi:hypothetical protein N665_0015s0025 [Sinapis alba]|nr:hypothetical protein N665_0015s0025 [Sinapis alba]